MKRLAFFLLLAATLLAGIHAQTKGPTVDKILFNAKSQEDIGLMDVASGSANIVRTGGTAVLDEISALSLIHI